MGTRSAVAVNGIARLAQVMRVAELREAPNWARVQTPRSYQINRSRKLDGKPGRYDGRPVVAGGRIAT
jgi:hypothetical protein